MKNKFNYDYSETLWMKIFCANPDFINNRSTVYFTFEQVLDVVRIVDRLTFGIKKILYLVGWQGLGHDDCYPDIDTVNESLKRDCDNTARDSLYWLFEEAKKYNTVISYHVNMADAYTQSKSFKELVSENAVVNDINGNPTPIEIFNGRNGYKISYKQFYESGLFKRIWDRFCATVPVKEAKTVHLDNFCIAESLNPRTDVYEQDDARNKMLDYIASLGIDVTTEYTYRELPLRADSPTHPIRKFYNKNGIELVDGSWQDAPIRTLGRIPAAWWMSCMKPEECIEISPKVYSGRMDEKLRSVFYGAMHGEDIWMKYGKEPDNWVQPFIHQFCTEQLPYLYLNNYKRFGIKEDDHGKYIAIFDNNIVTSEADMSIKKNDIILKKWNNVILPLNKSVFIAYSENGFNGEWEMPDAEFESASIYEINQNGNFFVENRRITDKKIKLDVKPGKAFAIMKA